MTTETVALDASVTTPGDCMISVLLLEVFNYQI